MVGLAQQFHRKDRSRQEHERMRREWFIRAQQDHNRKKIEAEENGADFIDAAAAIVMANDIQIAAFEVRLDAYEGKLDRLEDKLDAYETSITAALMRNQQRLDEIETELSDVNPKYRKHAETSPCFAGWHASF